MFGRQRDDQTKDAAHPGAKTPPESTDEQSCCCGGCSSDVTPIGPEDPDATQALIDSLAHERDDFKDKWLRAMAEYQNFQRRAISNEQEAKRQGVTSVLMSLVPALDAFEMALSAAPKDEPGRGVLAGMTAVQQSLLTALGHHGVSVIKPGSGDEFDPNKHSAIMQQPGTTAAGEPIEPGRVSMCLQVGYLLSTPGAGERVIRSAKVAIAPESAG